MMQNKNIKLTLSWNGEKFSGYQYQPHAFTVQEALTKAWEILAREQVQLIGCSRLDAGVHAYHYVLNFLTATQLSADEVVRKLNGVLHIHLKLDISIYKAEFVADNFHARFDSVGKHYRYLIWYGFGEHAFLTKNVWHLHRKVAPENISSILKQFEGQHDFSAFRAGDCGAKTTVRTIHRVETSYHPHCPELLIIDIYGNGFLKNMIRNMVGTAVDIATNKLPENTILEAFVHKDRNRTGVCAPACGLTLMQVYY